MPDFRVDVGFFTHIKTKRLRKRLGLEGVFALQLLWAYAAQCEHDHERVYTKEDIEIAVDWDGDDDIAGVLADVGYLDTCDGGYKIHEWEVHNGFASTAAKRSEHARNAANKRWQMREQCPSIAGAMPDSEIGNAPSPSPLPSPAPSPKKKSLTATHPEYADYVRTFQARVEDLHGNLAPRVTDGFINEAVDVIDKLVRIDGFTFDEIKEAMDWATGDDFWGKNALALTAIRKKLRDGTMKFKKIAADMAKSKPKVNEPVYISPFGAPYARH